MFFIEVGWIYNETEKEKHEDWLDYWFISWSQLD